MGRKANTIYQDAKNNKSDLYIRLKNIAIDDNKQIEEYTIDEILEEAKYLKSVMMEGDNWYDIITDDIEDISEDEMEEYKSIMAEYKDLCKFIDKWSNKQNGTVKQTKSNKIIDKKEILKTLEKGTKINIIKYGIVELVQVNRTRFYAIYNNQEWSFPIENFIEVVK